MSSQNTNEKDNPSEESNDNLTSNVELILSNSSLRNLYQIGFNSRNLTKSIVTSLKISEITSSIIKYASSNDLSIRSYGPLLLGLVRIYDKKIKFLLEEACLIFRQKISQDNKGDNGKTKQKGKKSKEEEKNISSTSKKKFALNSSFNILSLSPIQDNVFSLMNNFNSTSKSKNSLQTPSKSNLDMLTIDSKEILRRSAQQQSSNTKSVALITGKENESMSQQFLGSQRKDSIKDEDINNFFAFIQDGEGPATYPNNQIIEGPNEVDDLNLNYNFDLDNNTNLIGKITLNSLSVDSNIANQIKVKKKEIKLIKGKNAKFEFDDKINIRITPVETLPTSKMKKLMNLLKYNILNKVDNGNIENFNNDSKYAFLYPNLEKVEEESQKRKENSSYYTSEKKNISIDDFHTNSNQLLNNLSRLTLDKGDFDNIIPFTDKINQIEEEEADENQIENNIPDLSNLNANNYEEIENSNNKSEVNRDENVGLKELSILLKNKYFKKKKDIIFTSIDNQNSSAQLFYNLLILGQRGEVELNQNKLFSNKDIHIIKI